MLSQDYVALLRKRNVRISMSRVGTSYDNAQAQNYFKTLKCEEVYRREYRNLEEARLCIRELLEETYNRQRLHSALGHRPPEE